MYKLKTNFIHLINKEDDYAQSITEHPFVLSQQWYIINTNEFMQDPLFYV